MKTGPRGRLAASVGVLAAAGMVLAACGGGSSSGESSSAAPEPASSSAAPASSEAAPTEEACTELMPVNLQLQWFVQAQFGGYYAAKDKGFYEEQCLDVTILEGGVDIVPQTQLAQGAADYAIAWVPKALASREQGAGIVDVAQVFQRSGTLQVSWADSGISTPADLAGKKVGNWGFGNEYELFAGLTQAGLKPGKDVELVQQQFDMHALFNREIDAAQAMTYNEYAQVLEINNGGGLIASTGIDINPDTGELYQPEDFTVINWNDVGTAMYQDAIWASEERLADPAYQEMTQAFVTASLKGWIYCRDNAQECADIITANGSKLGASHQLWMMNEVNKLIWPSPLGVGVIDPALWTQTVTVALITLNADEVTIITADPGAAAYTNQYAEAANAALTGEGLDTTGDGFAPITVELKEGGA